MSYPRYFENTGTIYLATFVEQPRPKSNSDNTGNPFFFNPMASKQHNDMHGVKGGYKEGAGGYDNFARVTVFVDTDGDGDLDMLWQKNNNVPDRELRHFENTGTSTNPLFVTQDTVISGIEGRFGAAVVDTSGLLNILVTSKRIASHDFTKNGALLP